MTGLQLTLNNNRMMVTSTAVIVADNAQSEYRNESARAQNKYIYAQCTERALLFFALSKHIA